MTAIRLEDGICLHSPVEIDSSTRSAIERLGPVRAIIAPSTFHHFFVASAQAAFPTARTFAVRGLEAKRKDLRFDELLGDEPPALWAGQMDQVVVGNRVMREVDLLHRRRAAPELRWFTRDRKAARRALERLLAWDFDRAVIAHGELLEGDPHKAIREAWHWVLDR